MLQKSMSEVNKQKLNKDEVLKTIKRVVDFMDTDCQIEVKEERGDNCEEGTVVVSIQTSDNARFLIGKNGQNLKALEHIIRSMLIKPTHPEDDSDKENKIVLDINDYKKSRASYLIDVAKQVVARVRNTQKAEALFPMSAYERRIVHMELAAYPDIATESIGSEPQRRIIIKPYP